MDGGWGGGPPPAAEAAAGLPCWARLLLGARCNQAHVPALHFVFPTFSFKTRMGDTVSHLYCVGRDYSGAAARQATEMAIFYLGVRL